MTKIDSEKVSIINVYRSNTAGIDFIEKLKTLIDLDKTVIICGDFNFCASSESNNGISLFFKNMNFLQFVNDATHREGRALDHIYLYQKDNTFTHTCQIFGCYYSDHDKVTLYLKYQQ